MPPSRRGLTQGRASFCAAASRVISLSPPSRPTSFAQTWHVGGWTKAARTIRHRFPLLANRLALRPSGVEQVK